MAQHGLAAHPVQYLGEVRKHALAFTRGKDYDRQGHSVNLQEVNL
jgi:hypothetical protein